MQSGYTGHIVPAEWRWVIIVAGALVLLAFVPFIWILLSGTAGSAWQFMGMLHGYPDGPTYLAKMLQGGREGIWLIHFQHTPEPHSGMFLEVIYPLLGQLARLISLPPFIMFHIARVGAALIMYLAIYQLAASIWMRIRTRRIFFIIAAVGSGLGWLLGTLTRDATFPDLATAEAFPFASTLVNVHYPLALACMALLASLIITAFRPGVTQDPDMHNGGLVGVLLSLLLALVYPEAAILLSVVATLYVAIYCWSLRRITERALRWLLVILMPSVPVILLYFSFLNYNPAMAEWNRQKVAHPASPLLLALSLGIPLLLALPGIVRAFRRFEADGDQFVLIWLVALLVAIYLPTNIHQHFAAGLMLPIAYFAARSIEDFWLEYVNRRWRYRLFAAIVPLMSASHLFVLFLPILPVLAGHPDQTAGLLLERDYAAVFQWLDDHTRSNDVILASPVVSAWLPAWADVRVVYGHPYETLDARVKEQAVLAWYRDASASHCDDLLKGKFAFGEARYTVRFVLIGPQEQALGTSACIARLEWVGTIGSVNIYAP